MGSKAMPRVEVVDEEAQNKPVKKPRGRNGTGTPSLQKNFLGEPSDISRTLSVAKALMEMPRVQSDEECRQRISDYFQFCIDNETFPLWEGLALYLGVVRKTLWDWQNGRFCSAERCDMVKRAKEALASFDAALAQKGKIQPVVYIFRAKNFFDMRDQQDVVLAPNTPLGEQADKKQLEEKVADLVIDAEE